MPNHVKAEAICQVGRQRGQFQSANLLLFDPDRKLDVVLDLGLLRHLTSDDWPVYKGHACGDPYVDDEPAISTRVEAQLAHPRR